MDFLEADENALSFIVMMAAQFSEYTQTTEFYTLNESIVWYVNYISIKMSFKKKKNHEDLNWKHNSEDREEGINKRDYRARKSTGLS